MDKNRPVYFYLKSVPKWIQFILWIISPYAMYSRMPSTIAARKRHQLKQLEKEREITRNFRIELRESFFGVRTDYVQREKPLTDVELDEIYKNQKTIRDRI